ncbi:pyruvate dehydrogenase (acetyl-transferring) E1 component subunit alpha [Sediminispirochaeta smaragdinae]|uniref:Pyruvate dehydrogenase E1 component subunit alpha n=1 Tax=Sediminispirochaeta smaragdinae (strain DSM 11293 / JCM 15392 / SEBR 4228) TaxID=573413 RepID=E1RBK6_SEDSS|nr:pyruvate dehydrogenase (acetyl-transferring) E1 component subunit alpha [Sediminispirochaeta smaragdinae]ADK79736.1 pyruvate dehydrogenase (acetyl-transferring) E1 component, alpha subunit [Sediminispirochaeta smaragdinae DSM 11293]
MTDTKQKTALYKKMLLIRRFEEKAAQMYGLRKIGGFCHLYIGQEAVATGAIGALDLKSDYIVAAYRDHGHALASGMDPKAVMAELYGKVTGCSKGKGGSMHMFDIEKHMFGGNGIVGSQIPVATGVGLKIRYREEDGVVLCFFGDGAIHQGAFHESLNLAKIYGLPVVYICENNQYGMGTDFRRVSAVDDFSVMASSYGIEGRQIDGMDVITVHENVKELVEKARKEHMPSLLEIKTYRYKGHSMSDPAKYRTREELEDYKERDPILILKKGLLEDGVQASDLEAWDKEAKKLSEEAASFAEESPEPEIEALYSDILA